MLCLLKWKVISVVHCSNSCELLVVVSHKLPCLPLISIGDRYLDIPEFLLSVPREKPWSEHGYTVWVGGETVYSAKSTEATKWGKHVSLMSCSSDFVLWRYFYNFFFIYDAFPTTFYCLRNGECNRKKVRLGWSWNENLSSTPHAGTLMSHFLRKKKVIYCNNERS